MDLIKTVVRLDFSEATRPWLEMREILRVVGENPTAEVQASTLVLDQAEKRQRVILAVRGFTLERELPASADESVDEAVQMVTRLNDVSTLPSVKQIRHDSVFIEPYALPFHELVVFLKDRFLQSNPIVESATDIGLIFDQHEDQVVKHIQIGPMDADQLRRDYLRWSQEGIPDTCLFLGVAYESNRVEPYSIEDLREFLKHAIRSQASQVEAVLNCLR